MRLLSSSLAHVCAPQVHVPEGLTLLELDLIRLVAQFVARNGKNFLTGKLRRDLLAEAT